MQQRLQTQATGCIQKKTPWKSLGLCNCCRIKGSINLCSLFSRSCLKCLPVHLTTNLSLSPRLYFSSISNNVWDCLQQHLKRWKCTSYWTWTENKQPLSPAKNQGSVKLGGHAFQCAHSQTAVVPLCHQHLCTLKATLQLITNSGLNNIHSRLQSL